MKKRRKVFNLKEKTYLEEFNAETLYFTHESGIEILNIKSEFKENAFGIAFKTIPNDNTGVAHIIEHAVFCGSERYKLKDPFLYLIKGSLNTFLNAMTFPDKTIYPAASTIEADYFNLFKVYADSIFNPMLKKESFMQEGYNINPKNFSISGIVFNEMKGNYSNKNSLMNELSINSLFNDNAYKYDSGGNPIYITDINYKDFIDFYKKHYTLSNCKIVVFGNIETEKHLNYIDKYIIRSYKRDRQPFDLNIENTKRWTKSKILEYKIPKDNENELGTYIINWLCEDVSKIEENIALEMLSSILLDDSCPFLVHILKSEIGEDISKISGINTDLKESVFSFGLQNVKPNKLYEFKNLVFNELKKLVNEKIPIEIINGILFNYEFEIKDEKQQGFPIYLMLRIFKNWIHGVSPIEGIKISYYIEKIKNKIKNGELYFENLIQKYLIDNNHYTLINFIPSDKIAKEMEEKIEEKLIKKEIELKKNPEEFKKFKLDYENFKKYQKKKDSKSEISKLPVLKRKDLPIKIEKSMHLDEVKKLNSYSCEYKQKDIFSISLFFNLDFLDREDFIYLSIFKRALQELSSKKYFYTDFNNKIQNTFGQLVISDSFDLDIKGKMLNLLNISFKSFNHKIKDSFHLINEIINNINFYDFERLKEIILSLKNDFKNILVLKGHIFAVSRSSSKLKINQYIKELQNGLTGREFWQKIKTNKESLIEIADKLKNLKNKIFLKNSFSALIMGNNSIIIKNLEDELSKIMDKLSNLSNKNYNLNSRFETNYKNNLKEIIIIPSKVSFNALSFESYSINENEYAATKFLSHILTSEKLWEKIRVVGGAYGAFSLLNNGIFSFVSYRDPNFIKTYQNFQNSLEEISKIHINDDLNRYLTGVIGLHINVKSNTIEASKSYKRKRLGISDELRQNIRNNYFKITTQEIKEIAEKLLTKLKIKNSLTALLNNDIYENEKEKFEENIGTSYKIKRIN